MNDPMNDGMNGEENALRAALGGHGIVLPHLRSLGGRLALGEADVETAQRLAEAFGAAPLTPGLDLQDWREAHILAGRLTRAVRERVQGAFLDTYFHPDCVRCDRESAVALGDIDLPAAHRLTAALVGDA